MKKFIYTFLITAMILTGSLAFAQANKDYTTLAPIPFAVKDNGTTDLAFYVSGLFKLLIGAGAVLAFLYIFWYGFEYMFSDSFLKKGNARERITDVLGGLALIILSYAIIYNLNPDFLKGTLTLKNPSPKVNTIDITSEPGEIGNTPGGGSQPPTGTCSGCQNVGGPGNASGLTLSARTTAHCQRQTEGCFLNASLVSKLQTLNRGVSGLVLTEVWPASRSHVNGCHSTGTCVDAVFSGTTAREIADFIKKSKDAGLNSEYETFDSALAEEVRRLAPAGSRVLVLRRCQSNTDTQCITGPHFSVYNN